MEATKKTTATRAALLVLAALSMLLSGLFIATASRSDAQAPPACPAGFNLTADAKNCFQAAVVTTADNPNSCDVGQLTPDGTTCYVAARLIPQQGQTLCPKGYSPDDSLQGMCARFEPASQHLPGCPDGALGVAGGCYIRVAFGPRGAGVCPAGTTLSGAYCVVTGAAPVSGPSTCPVSATVLQEGSECYSLVGKVAFATCNAPYTAFGTSCKVSNPMAANPATAATWTCPATGAKTASGDVIEPVPSTHTIGGIQKIESCSYMPVHPDNAGQCPDGTDPDPNGVDCRREVTRVPGAKACATGYGLVDNKCIRFTGATVPEAACPLGSVFVTVSTAPASAECRKPVADAPGAYYCKDANAALNGKSCVWTTGFLINPSPNLYKCDTGGVRTVIGSGAETRVICLVGPANANATTGPSCLQGVLSTDNLYCIVPRIDTAPAGGAAPVPAFTG